MAKGIQDLGNGNGWIYKVAPVASPANSDIIQALPNNEDNAREVKVEGIKAKSSALNQSPNASIRVLGVTGSGSITRITVNDNQQIDVGSPINYTGATSIDALASDIENAMNSYDAGTGTDYTAVASGSIIYIYGENSIGSADNGSTPVVTTTGNSSYSYTDVSGGSDANSLYNEGFGYRFYLDADYDASGCSGIGSASPDSIANAVEITDYLVPRDYNAATPEESLTIFSGSVSPKRSSVFSVLYIDTESSSASDDLNSIIPSGYAEGDRVLVRGVDSGRVVTVKSGTGNIELENSADFNTAGFERSITLQLKGSTWYEISRTNAATGSTSDFRSSGFGFFGIDTYNTSAVINTGSVSYTGGVDSNYIKITGSSTLVSNSFYELNTIGAVNGDKFKLVYDATVTTGAFNLSIFGVTLTSEQALNGGLIFDAEFRSGSWYTTVTPNNDNSASNRFKSGSEDIKDGAISSSKLESSLKKGFFTKEVHFDSSGLGIVDVEVPFALTVDKVVASVSGDISGTDDATLVIKDDSSSAMSDGQIDFPASTPIGNTYSTEPSSNNVFAADEKIKFETLKSNPGGRATVTIHYTRT